MRRELSAGSSTTPQGRSAGTFPDTPNPDSANGRSDNSGPSGEDDTPADNVSEEETEVPEANLWILMVGILWSAVNGANSEEDSTAICRRRAWR